MKEESIPHEGILQLRKESSDKAWEREIAGFIASKASAAGLHIVKIVSVKGRGGRRGVDFYFDNQHKLQSFSLKMASVLNATLKKSPRLQSFDRVHSRRLYRVNILLELPPFSNGEIIMRKESEGIKRDFFLKVVSCNSRRLLARGLDTAAYITINLKECKDFVRVQISSTNIVSMRPVIKVIHPSTFQAVPLIIPSFIKKPQTRKLAINSAVRVVANDKSVWLVGPEN